MVDVKGVVFITVVVEGVEVEERAFLRSSVFRVTQRAVAGGDGITLWCGGCGDEEWHCNVRGTVADAAHAVWTERDGDVVFVADPRPRGE